uniref:Uncharacterized protein n=1 Tax=Capra hircus TaxID=9925 RepID=A0A452E5X9_CAPHI
MKARSLNRFLKLMKCSLMPRKGDHMITKEENRQLKKVEQEVVLEEAGCREREEVKTLYINL